MQLCVRGGHDSMIWCVRKVVLCRLSCAITNIYRNSLISNCSVVLFCWMKCSVGSLVTACIVVGNVYTLDWNMRYLVCFVIIFGEAARPSIGHVLVIQNHIYISFVRNVINILKCGLFDEFA